MNYYYKYKLTSTNTCSLSSKMALLGPLQMHLTRKVLWQGYQDKNLIYLALFLQCMNRNMRKRTFWHVPITKTQINMRIPAIWSESSLSAWWNYASLAIKNVPSEDSDQPAWMRRLIWIFAGRISQKVRFDVEVHITHVSSRCTGSTPLWSRVIGYLNSWRFAETAQNNTENKPDTVLVWIQVRKHCSTSLFYYQPQNPKANLRTCAPSNDQSLHCANLGYQACKISSYEPRRLVRPCECAD